MDKLYIVVDGIEHQYFDCDSTGYYLISYDPLSENNGYKLFDSELKQYRKYLTEKQVKNLNRLIRNLEKANKILTTLRMMQVKNRILIHP